MKIWAKIIDEAIAGVATSPSTSELSEWQELDGSDPKVMAFLLETARKEKISSLSFKCGEVIRSGFQSSALGASHHYASKEEDQLNLIGAKTAGIALHYVCTDEHGDKRSRLHTAAQITQVFQDGLTRKSKMIQHFHDLRLQVEAAQTFLEIQVISWSDPTDG